MARRKTRTLARRLSELSRALTYLRNEVSVFRALRGRKTRSTLIDFRAFSAFDSMFMSDVMKSNIAAMTIMKSMTFQGSLRYVCLPKTKPFANILIIASRMKTTEKKRSKRAARHNKMSKNKTNTHTTKEHQSGY